MIEGIRIPHHGVYSSFLLRICITLLYFKQSEQSSGGQEIVTCHVEVSENTTVQSIAYGNLDVSAITNLISFEASGNVNDLIKINTQTYISDTEMSPIHEIRMNCSSSALLGPWHGFQTNRDQWRVCDSSQSLSECQSIYYSHASRKRPIVSSSGLPYISTSSINAYVTYEGNPYTQYGSVISISTSYNPIGNVEPDSGRVVIHVYTEDITETDGFFTEYEIVGAEGVGRGEVVSAYVRTRSKITKILLRSLASNLWNYWLISVDGVVVDKDPNGRDGTYF